MEGADGLLLFLVFRLDGFLHVLLDFRLWQLMEGLGGRHKADLDGLYLPLGLSGLGKGLNAQSNGLLQGHAILVLLLEELGDRAPARAYAPGLVCHERPAGIGLEQVCAALVHAGHQQRGPEGPGATILGVVLHEVADLFDKDLDRYLLCICDLVDLSLYARPVDKYPSVRDQAGCGTANVLIYLEYLVYRAGFDEPARYLFVNDEDDTVLELETERRGTPLDGLSGVLDLE